MRLATLYALVGLIWGLLLGALVAWEVMALAAGLSWLYLFGDDTWPAEVNWVIPLLGVVTFVATLGMCIALGISRGRSWDRGDTEQLRRRRTQGLRLLVFGLLLTLALGGAAFERAVEQREERALLREQSSWFERLQRNTQKLESASVAGVDRGAMTYSLELFTAGAHAGAYRFDWAMRARTYGATLGEGRREISLKTGTNSVPLTIDARPILESYRDIALSDPNATVGVDAIFELEFRLYPVLSEDEISRLPPHETADLDRGESLLTATLRIDFPMSFRLSRGRAELLE